MQNRKRRKLDKHVWTPDTGPILTSGALEMLQTVRDPASLAWNSSTRFDNGSCTCWADTSPFPSLQLEGFFDKNCLRQVRHQLLTQVEFHTRRSDLFSYSGSNDLADDATVSPGSPLARLRDAIYSSAVTELLGLCLNIRLSRDTRPDLSSHIYRQGDFLACHDDDIRQEDVGRRIAFILYLVEEDWSESADGGQLNLFDMCVLHLEFGFPSTIRRRVLPQFGRLTVFEVTSISYHEVAEVLGKRDRLSISGWFHGPLSQRAQLASSVPRFDECGPLRDFVAARLVDNSPANPLASAFRSTFESEGYIQISDFLLEPVYESVVEEAQRVLAKAPKMGPASARRQTWLTPANDRLQHLFSSVAFKALLESWTGLQVKSHRIGLRCFGAGDYQLLHDHIQDAEGLDVLLSLQPRRMVRPPNARGDQLYVLSAQAPNGIDSDLHEEPLLRVAPVCNQLTIVMRDTYTLKYVERVSAAHAGVWKRIDLEALYEVTES